MAHILIAEDDISTGRFIAAALERAGHNVTLTHDGLSALKTLETPENFNLLLTDIVMPGIDGIELSRRAVKMRPNLKIMYITGFSAMEAATGREGPVLAKPFHLGDLVAQVETLLQPA